jgi:hypothetical protein
MTTVLEGCTIEEQRSVLVFGRRANDSTNGSQLGGKRFADDEEVEAGMRK